MALYVGIVEHLNFVKFMSDLQNVVHDISRKPSRLKLGLGLGRGPLSLRPATGRIVLPEAGEGGAA